MGSYFKLAFNYFRDYYKKDLTNNKTYDIVMAAMKDENLIWEIYNHILDNYDELSEDEFNAALEKLSIASLNVYLKAVPTNKRHLNFG